MTTPIILWLRRDFRLTDNEALSTAAETNRPIIPVFIHDPLVEALGAAPKWRLGEAIANFSSILKKHGSRLILRRGDALGCLQALITETGADTVIWSRAYDPDTVARDKVLKATLKTQGLSVQSHPGQLLFEPWTVEKGTGGPYGVYTPYWRNVAGREVSETLPPPKSLRAPQVWPASDMLADWKLDASMNRGAGIVAKHAPIGEQAAFDRLSYFLGSLVDAYADDRNRPDRDATSRMSAHLTTGEISPRMIWHAAQRALTEGRPGAETFLKELVWREFAWHLLWHNPQLATQNWRDGWDKFPWRGENDDATLWKRGLTGEPIVDAGMRELYVTGTMHNRVRMITASYLTKHLLTDWRVGLKWFEETLVDWDPASNAMGWQWVAGCGPDASPFFRIFNPATQAEKFDPNGAYRAKYLQADGATDFFKAFPQSWHLSRNLPAPGPIISLADGRARALAAYKAL